MQHYFVSQEYSASDIFQFNTNILGHNLTFNSVKGVFNYTGVDDGTQALLNAIYKYNINPSGNVLDIGCGLGIIGIALSKKYNVEVTYSDVNSTVTDLCKLNLKQNNLAGNVITCSGYDNISSTFDYIITNPPIKAGKKVLFDICIGAYEHLTPGGKILLVIRKNLGMDSLRKAMIDKFGNCSIVARDKGYYILCSQKKD